MTPPIEPQRDLSALCIVGGSIRLNHKFSVSGPCAYCGMPFPSAVLRPDKPAEVAK